MLISRQLHNRTACQGMLALAADHQLETSEEWRFIDVRRRVGGWV
jgi:hypothetical protein